MADSDVKDNFITRFNQLFSYLSIEHKFMCEVPESTLNSVAEYSILIGVNGSYEGNFMFGFTKETALEMAIALMGTKNVDKISFNVKAALADLFFDYAQRVINMSNLSGNILLSSPTFISGSNMKALISKVPAINFFCKVKGDKFSISYYLQKL